MNLKKTIAGCCALFLLYSMPLHTAALDSTCIGYGRGKQQTVKIVRWMPLLSMNAMQNTEHLPQHLTPVALF